MPTPTAPPLSVEVPQRQPATGAGRAVATGSGAGRRGGDLRWRSARRGGGGDASARAHRPERIQIVHMYAFSRGLLLRPGETASHLPQEAEMYAQLVHLSLLWQNLPFVRDESASYVRLRKAARDALRSSTEALATERETPCEGQAEREGARKCAPCARSSYISCVEYTVSSCHRRISPAARVARRSMRRWFDEPRKRSDMS